MRVWSLVAALAACLGLGPTSAAVAQQTLYWSGTSGTSAPLWSTLAAWSTLPGSWSPPTAIPSAADTAVFNISSLTTPQDVYLGGNQAAFGLTFSSTAATALRGGSLGSPALNTLTTRTGGISVGLGAGPVVIGTGSSDDVDILLGGSQTWNNLDRGRQLIVRGGVAGSATSGNSQTLTVTGAGFTTLDGVLSDGAGGGVLNLTKTGTGPLRLGSNANTYTGTTTVSAGGLVISSTGSLGRGTSTVAVNAGGLLYLDGSQSPMTLARNISLSGTRASLISNGQNTITGEVARSGLENALISSVFGTLRLSGSVVLGASTTQVGGNSTIVINGPLSGTAELVKVRNGTLFLDPSDSSNFSGTLNTAAPSATGFTSIRITKNFVIGSNPDAIRTTGAGDQVFSLWEVRMDAPLLQTTGSINANWSNTSHFSAGSRLFVDHGVGSTETSGTLVLGNITGNLFPVTRNGYRVEVGNIAPFDEGNHNWGTQDASGGVTITGTTRGNMNFGGVANTLVTGNVTGTVGNTWFLNKSGNGLFTITGTAGSIGGAVSVSGGGLAITDFRSLNNIATGTINLGSTTATGQLIIGTTTAPGDAAALSSQRRINLAGTTGNAAIYASQSGANPVVIPNIATTGTGNKAVVLGGTSTLDNLISGTIANLATGTTSLQKTGPGTWVLSGPNTFTGTSSILQGTLNLDATAASSAVLNSGVGITFNADTTVNSAGGRLVFTGFSGATTTQTVGALTPTAGAGRVVVTNNGGTSTTLTFASLGARGTGATLDYAPGSNAAIVLTNTTGLLTNGILAAASGGAAFQTFGGTDWATATSGTVQAFTAYEASLPTAGTTGASINYSMSADVTTTAAASYNTLKIVGGGSNPTLTLGGALTLTAKGLLFDNSAGGAAITGGQLGVSAVETVIHTGGGTPANPLTISAAIGGGTGSLTKAGGGLLVISGSNAFTGNTTINEGTVQLSGAAATLGTISTAANTTTLRQNATLDINAAGPANTVTIGSLTGAGTVTNSGGGTNAAGTLAIGQGTTTTASGTFTGILQDGPGVLNVTKNGTGNQVLLGLSTYTGVTTINSGTLTVDVLADGGVASGIGQSGGAAANLVFGNNGSLTYAGAIRSAASGMQAFGSQSTRTNRLFTIAGTGTTTITSDASLSNALVWTNTGAIVHSGAAARTLNLAGTSAGDNALFPQITDSAGNVTSVLKSGTGIWLLAGSTNTYTGPTTIAGGFLGLTNPGALSASSPLQVGVTGATGTLLMSGTLTREIVASPTPGQSTITLGGATTGGAGFAALGEKLVVAFQQSGTLQPLTWGSGGFLGTSGTLALGAPTAVNEVEFRNPIDLGGGTRTISLVKSLNTAADGAIMSGVISGSGGLVIAGSGRLALAANNTYSGSTTHATGSSSFLAVQSLGNSTTGSAASSLGSFVSGSAGALTLGGGSTLQYVGPGEITDRMISLTGNAAIGNFGSGPLVIANVVSANSTAKRLTLGGQNIYANEISSNLTDNGTAGSLTLAIADDVSAWSPAAPITWILSGSNSLSGTSTVTNGGLLGFASDASGNIGVLIAGGQLQTGGIFAVGGDRRLAIALEPRAHGSPASVHGDYSITLTLPARTNNAISNGIENYLASGKSLTLEGGIAGSNHPFFPGALGTLSSAAILRV